MADEDDPFPLPGGFRQLAPNEFQHRDGDLFVGRDGQTLDSILEEAAHKPAFNPATRDQRNELLRESDWTQLPDAPVDQQRWAIYRQQLRDLDMTSPVWPEQPGKGMTAEDTARIEAYLDKAARTVLVGGKNKP